jgi:predicted transcriptional regulator
MEGVAMNIKSLLPHGSGVLIAKKLGISSSAVSQALKDGRPGSPAVQEALAMARASGALEAAQTLATLTHAK